MESGPLWRRYRPKSGVSTATHSVSGGYEDDKYSPFTPQLVDDVTDVGTAIGRIRPLVSESSLRHRRHYSVGGYPLHHYHCNESAAFGDRCVEEGVFRMGDSEIGGTGMHSISPHRVDNRLQGAPFIIAYPSRFGPYQFRPNISPSRSTRSAG